MSGLTIRISTPTRSQCRQCPRTPGDRAHPLQRSRHLRAGPLLTLAPPFGPRAAASPRRARRIRARGGGSPSASAGTASASPSPRAPAAKQPWSSDERCRLLPLAKGRPTLTPHSVSRLPGRPVKWIEDRRDTRYRSASGSTSSVRSCVQLRWHDRGFKHHVVATVGAITGATGWGMAFLTGLRYGPATELRTRCAGQARSHQQGVMEWLPWRREEARSASWSGRSTMWQPSFHRARRTSDGVISSRSEFSG